MTWDWNFGDGSSGSGPNVSHTYSSSGTYSVTLTVTDQCGVTKSKTRSVTVAAPSAPPPPPAPTHVRTTADASGVDGVAPGDPVSSASGELYFTTSDLSFGGMYPTISFTRHYASYLSDDGIVSSALGTNWMHNYDLKLLAGSTTATVVYHGGKSIEFERAGGNWVLKGPESVVFQLLEGDGHFHLFDPSTDLIYTFDYCQKLRLVTNRNIKSLILTYADDRLVEVADEFGRSLRFTYTADKLTRVQDQSGRSIYFSYTGDYLTAYTDARGNTTSYTYTEAGGIKGLMTDSTFPEGNSPFTQSFDQEGRVRAQSDSSGNTVSILYNTPAEGVTTMIDPLGYSTEHTHEDAKYLVGAKDQEGESTSYSYDDAKRRIQLKDRNGNATFATYHIPSGKIASYTDAEGNTTHYTYSLQYKDELDYYNLTRIDFPDGTFVTMTHNWAGHVESLTDRSGGLWQYTYALQGQMLTSQNPSGGVTTYTYNADGTRASRTDHFGNTTTYTYDGLKRLSRVTHPDGTFRSLTYDGNDNILSVTDEGGMVTRYTYDTNDNLQSVTDPLGNTVTFAYDGNDRLKTLVDPLGGTTTYSYDGLGRVQSTTNPVAETTTFGHSPQGWRAALTGPGGATTRIGYDKEGVITSLTDPLSAVWTYDSDKRGKITRITSPLSSVWERDYDDMGRLTSQTDPLSRVTNYEYDSNGNLTAITLPGEISATYERNVLGQVTGITDPNGNRWGQEYDEMGRVVSRTDPLSNTTSYSYDNRNRLSAIDFPENSLQIIYDGSGKVLRRRYADGLDLEYTYDANQRLIAADGLSLGYDAQGDIANSNGISITRDSARRIVSMTLAIGKTVSYSYNSRGLVSRILDWAGGATELTYDDAGRYHSISRPNGVRTTYRYDEEGRLVGLVEGQNGILSSIALTRNGNGDITSAVRNVPLTPDPAVETQVFSYDEAAQIVGYTYDTMGRRILDQKRTYDWDSASRLTTYSEVGKTVSFEYDGLGMCISRTEGSSKRTYGYNYALNIPSISVVREGGRDLRYYIHLPGGRLLHSIEASDDSRHFYHFDEMGTTTFLTDDAGIITDSYGVSPYGQLTARTGTTDNPFIFIGAYGVMMESASGLYSMRARYYDSNSQQFVSRDPVKTANPRGVVPYQYALGNPQRFSDPMGTIPSWAEAVDAVAGWFGYKPPPPPPRPSWWNKPGGFNQSGESALSYPKGGEKAPPMSLEENLVPFAGMLVPTVIGGLIFSPLFEYGIVILIIVIPPEVANDIVDWVIEPSLDPQPGYEQNLSEGPGYDLDLLPKLNDRRKMK